MQVSPEHQQKQSKSGKQAAQTKEVEQQKTVQKTVQKTKKTISPKTKHTKARTTQEKNVTPRYYVNKPKSQKNAQKSINKQAAQTLKVSRSPRPTPKHFRQQIKKNRYEVGKKFLNQ